MDNTNSNHFLIVKSKVEFTCDTAIEVIETVGQYHTLVLPDIVKGYFAKKYEGDTGLIKNEVEKECHKLIEELIGSGIILQFLNKEECFHAMSEYAIWAVKQKAAQNNSDILGAETLIDKLKLERGKSNVPHFLNINDLKEVLNKDSIPENFVVWVQKYEYGYTCIGGCEFNKRYKYIAIYK